MFFVKINDVPDVDGIEADEIDDGLDTVETFLCSSCFFISLWTDSSRSSEKSY